MRKIKTLFRQLKILLPLMFFMMLIMSTALSIGTSDALSVGQSDTSDFAVAHFQCGSLNGAVVTTINFGCYGDKCINKKGQEIFPSKYAYCNTFHNSISDLVFAIIRFISDGIGLIIIVSVIIAGIQYTFSRGEPQQLKQASSRLQSTLTALIIYIFAYALINYLIPNGFFGQ